MKLEKREITLNEYDSLKDIFYMEKLLLHEYIFSLAKVLRKESKSEILRLMQEVGEDAFFVRGLMRDTDGLGIKDCAFED